MAVPKRVLIIRHGEKYGGVPDPAPDADAISNLDADPAELAVRATR